MARLEITFTDDKPLYAELVLSERNLRSINRDLERSLNEGHGFVLENAHVILNGQTLMPWETGCWRVKIENDDEHYSDTKREEAKALIRKKKGRERV